MNQYEEIRKGSRWILFSLDLEIITVTFSEQSRVIYLGGFYGLSPEVCHVVFPRDTINPRGQPPSYTKYNNNILTPALYSAFKGHVSMQRWWIMKDKSQMFLLLKSFLKIWLIFKGCLYDIDGWWCISYHPNFKSFEI